ncbi:MAG TPA: beta-ketoacyl-ACP synthase II [Candidatus Brocadiia bacterium]|nr:beta-ketoacyl-ACP synthase II [Candidatus Brocadiia bacterium]
MGGRRVVVTGLGVISSIGQDVETFFQSLLQGKSGVRPIQSFDASDFPSRIAGEIPDFDPSRWIDNRTAQRIDRFTQMGLAASMDAVKDAGLDFSKEDPTAAGAMIGTGIGGLNEIETQSRRLVAGGHRKVSPFFVPKMMANACSGQISIHFGLMGPSSTAVTACAAGANSIGEAARMVQYGDADIMITGGSEAAITALGVSGFCSAKALSRRNDDPQRASRPFDAGRDGFVMGEGAGVIILEEYEHARARGARIYAEFLGYALTSDASHITAPHPEGAGAANAMTRALKDAGLNPDQISYINAHGTSTELNDAVETLAMKKTFGDAIRNIPVSSTKSMIGHLLGGSGGVEIVAAIMSIVRQAIHPTINQETPDPQCDLDYVPNTAREAKVVNIMSNSFGFGGHNASLVFGALR